MNNEEKILELLQGMDKRMEKLETDTAAIKAKMALLQLDVSDLKAGQTALQEDVSEIKTDVKYIWEDVGRIGDRLNAQEEIIQKKIM